jgi:hypothetical protein
MLTKCACGSYTNYGPMCVSCVMARTGEPETELNTDDCFEDEEESTSESSCSEPE